MSDIFEGVRVVELAQYVFVPAAGMMMADHGAEVIKIEPPEGDPYRTLKIGDGRDAAPYNVSMEQNNRGKKSLAVDLKTADGREALLRLIETADVFLTSLRPQALTALRLDPDDLFARNPRIIYARGNGLGFKGDEAGKAGYDASAFWARGGFAHLLTAPHYDAPVHPRPALGDHASATAMLAGISGALFKRERDGKGRVVETSLLQNAAWILSSDLTLSRAMANYQPHQAQGGSFRIPLMRAYKTKDSRWIQLMLLAPDKSWPEFCDVVELLDLVDDHRFATSFDRQENGQELGAIITDRIGSRDWAAWEPRFTAWKAPWELIRTIHELGNDPQIVANDVVFPLQLANGAVAEVVAGPITYDGRCRPAVPVPSPALGADSNALLAEIGYGAEEVAVLRAAGVVV